MKIITILGTRPEITKLSPLLPLLDQHFDHKVIHTGQHYDHNMDTVFFDELNLRKPDYMLNVGSSTHATQTAKMMVKIEEILLSEKPDWVIVFADPNTPLAGALVAVKLHVPLIHLEAGCRSFNKKMPEEINRIICDHCADLLLAPDQKAFQNLKKEGLEDHKIHVVGSTAIDAALRNIVIAREKSTILGDLDLSGKEFVLLTMHRAENTDDSGVLRSLVEAYNTLADKVQLVFPIHPRTKKALGQENLILNSKIKVTEPLGYLDLLSLLDQAKFVMSDSGGIQEEAAALNTPCIILRNETEWTYLVDAGKNCLVGNYGPIIEKTISGYLENPKIILEMKNVLLNLKRDVALNIIEIIKNGRIEK